jgi:A118 family predicted phage portal protein
MQCGFSAGTFSFDGETVKTATEVISENAKSFKTKQLFENQLTHGMLKLFAAIREIGDSYGLGGLPENISITWNDSIIEDRNSKAKFWNERYLNGTCTLEKYLINVDGLTPEDAAEEAEKIKESKRVIGGIEDMFGSDKSAKEEENVKDDVE